MRRRFHRRLNQADPFIDLLFNALLGFTFLFLVAVMFINPQARHGRVDLKAEYIIHTNGPKFKEEDEEGKLRCAVRSVLRITDEKGVKRLAIPPIGTGLYQVPMDLCARVMVDTVSEHLSNGSTVDEVLFVVQDTREYVPFEAKIREGV